VENNEIIYHITPKQLQLEDLINEYGGGWANFIEQLTFLAERKRQHFAMMGMNSLAKQWERIFDKLKGCARSARM